MLKKSTESLFYVHYDRHSSIRISHLSGHENNVPSSSDNRGCTRGVVLYIQNFYQYERQVGRGAYFQTGYISSYIDITEDVRIINHKTFYWRCYY